MRVLVALGLPRDRRRRHHRPVASTDVGLEFAHGHNPWRFPFTEAWVAFMETKYGPTLEARERLTADGR